jgi:hypothetical protein
MNFTPIPSVIGVILIVIALLHHQKFSEPGEPKDLPQLQANLAYIIRAHTTGIGLIVAGIILIVMSPKIKLVKPHINPPPIPLLESAFHILKFEKVE